MSEDHDEIAGLPIVCTLTPGELAAMRDGLLPGLLAAFSPREKVARSAG